MGVPHRLVHRKGLFPDLKVKCCACGSQKTKLNAPNSSKKSKLDVLNMVVELIKTEGKNMGEVQLEKGLLTFVCDV